MALNGTINKTLFTDATSMSNNPNSTLSKAVHINEIRTALNKLETYATKLDNCGYTNCCQSCQNSCNQCTDKCQSCQNSCSQCTDKCQSCQNTCSQCTDSCQRCQNTSCQSISCQIYSCTGCGGDSDSD